MKRRILYAKGSNELAGCSVAVARLGSSVGYAVSFLKMRVTAMREEYCCEDGPMPA